MRSRYLRAVSVVLSVVLLVGPLSSRGAAETNLAACDVGSASSAAYSNFYATNACDNDDLTKFVAYYSGRQHIHFYIAAGAQSVNRVRLYCRVGQCSTPKLFYTTSSHSNVGNCPADPGWYEIPNVFSGIAGGGDSGVVSFSPVTYQDFCIEAGAASNTWEAYSIELYSSNVPPPTPTGLAVTGVSSSSITLSWLPASTATSYSVSWASASSGPFLSLGTTSDTTFTASGLTTGTAYWFEVAAVNAYGSSALSSSVSGVPSSAPVQVQVVYLTGVVGISSIPGGGDPGSSAIAQVDFTQACDTAVTGGWGSCGWRGKWNTQNGSLFASVGAYFKGGAGFYGRCTSGTSIQCTGPGAPSYKGPQLQMYRLNVDGTRGSLVARFDMGDVLDVNNKNDERWQVMLASPFADDPLTNGGFYGGKYGVVIESPAGVTSGSADLTLAETTWDSGYVQLLNDGSAVGWVSPNADPAVLTGTYGLTLPPAPADPQATVCGDDTLCYLNYMVNILANRLGAAGSSASGTLTDVVNAVGSGATDTITAITSGAQATVTALTDTKDAVVAKLEEVRQAVVDQAAAGATSLTTTLQTVFLPTAASQTALMDLQATIESREPFSTFDRTGTVVGTIKDSFSPSASTSCSYTFSFTWPYVGPVSFQWALCSTLETMGGGTTEYQAVRTMAGVFIYVSFGYQLFRRFTPKPVVTA